MPRVHPRLGGDIYESEAGIVVLRRVRIHAKTNLANLRFRRQLATAKSVHADLRAGPGELVYSVLKLVRIVRKLRDLFFSQDVAEGWSIRVCVSYLSFFLYIDVDFDDVDVERHFPSRWTAHEIHIFKIERFETRSLDVNLITTSGQLIEACFASLIG